MHQGRSNYPKFQMDEKILTTTEMVCGPWKLGGTRKRDQSLLAFCWRLRAGYVKRVETIRLSSVSDPKKKIAGTGVSTISPVIASSRYPLLLRAPGRNRSFRPGRSLYGPKISRALWLVRFSG